MTRVRILHLIAGFIGAVVILAVGLADAMIAQHDTWLERSYRNRWVFRDVPTRRGAISDRAGIPLRTDAPAYELELRYRAFRRGHVVGLAVHGANLASELAGLAPVTGMDAPERFGAALDFVLDLDASVTVGAVDGLDSEDARDLRFYVGALLAELTGVRARVFHDALRRVRAEGRRVSVRALAIEECAALARQQRAIGDPRSAPRLQVAVFDERVRELRAMAQRLRREWPDFDLFAYLEARRAAAEKWREYGALPDRERRALRSPRFWWFLRTHAKPAIGVDADWTAWEQASDPWREVTLAAFEAWPEDSFPADDGLGDRGQLPWNEDAPRRVRAQVPYREAMWIALLADRHPGFELRPTVRRESPGLAPDAMGSGGLPGLESILGRVSALWATDVSDAGAAGGAGNAWLESAASIGAGTVDDFYSAWPSELPSGLGAALEAAARRTAYRHYLTHGRVGRGGVEASLDDTLSGRPGLRFVERDRDREQRLLDQLDVQPGRDVRITIDLRLQTLLERRLRAVEVENRLDTVRKAEKVGVLLDARSGDILAVAGFVDTGDGEGWQASRGAVYPAFNPYVGSVAKPLTALEHLDALRHGREATPHVTFAPCTGRLSRWLSCDHQHYGVSREPVEAISKSCNTFFYLATRGLGEKGLHRAYARFGWVASSMAQSPYTDRFDRGIAGFPDDSVATPGLRPYGQLEKQGIGYGVAVSPVFVARAYAGIATGELPTVSLLLDAEPRPRFELGVAPADLEVVRAGLRECTRSGTGRRVEWHGLDVFAKTGTAEVGSNRGKQNNAWFSGFLLPGRDAHLVFTVAVYRVPDGVHGGDVSAPVVSQILGDILADPELTASYLPGGDPAARRVEEGR